MFLTEAEMGESLIVYIRYNLIFLNEEKMGDLLLYHIRHNLIL